MSAQRIDPLDLALDRAAEALRLYHAGGVSTDELEAVLTALIEAAREQDRILAVQP